MGQVISVQCADYNPKQVLVTITGPDNVTYSFFVREQDYAVLAMLPGFPPNPCS